MACAFDAPRMAGEGGRLAQTAGLSGCPTIGRLAVSSCTQRSPAALPCGTPEMALEIDGAMQQAP
jgi:hypothetical protein